ncbi:MAG TPA: glycosyltransferase family 39 protein, partial [Pyrinomonadaceae bacterium]|nr:glycosyltransferase family 39 protein [Pyrinomonadaceae bacterium]
MRLEIKLKAQEEKQPAESLRLAVEHERHALEDDRALFAGSVAWKEWKALLGWTLLALLLRLLLVWRFEQVISPDGVEYVALGRSLMAGNFREGVSTYWSPLYPLLVGIASLFFRDAEFAGRFVSVIAGGLLVIPAHRLIRHWYGVRAALIGAGLVALHPLLIYYSTVLLTESTYTLFFISGVLAGWNALDRGRARSYLLAGAAFGACYLLKPEAAGFILLLLVPVLGRRLFEKTVSLKTNARNALLLCAGFMLWAAPYLVYLRHETDAWKLSTKIGGHMWQGSRLAAGEHAPASIPLMPGMTTALVQLVKALRFEYEIFNLIFPPVFVLFVGIGLFRNKWTSRRTWRELYLFSFIAAALAGYAVTLPNIRFIMPLLPLLLCWLSKGIIEFEEWAVETLRGFDGAKSFAKYLRKIIVPFVIACLLASLIPLFVYLLRGDKWGDYYGQKRAGVWIKEHDAARAPVIMSTVAIAAFYAGGRPVALVDEDYQSLIARARGEGVGYIIVNERDFRYFSLRPLLDEQSFHPGLRLVQYFAEAPGH